jgi:enediyne biosynthesis protein E4
MQPSRRAFLLGTLNTAMAAAFGQGVVSHKGIALPRGKRSGLPYDAHFVEMAHMAGIDHPILYGSASPKDYIIESIGCGCAFLDYDNDGWIDILVLGGSTLIGPPPRHHQPALPQQQGRYVSRCHGGSGPDKNWLGVRSMYRGLQQ